MFSSRKVLFTICALFSVIFIVNSKVSAAPAIDRIGGNNRYETAIKVSQRNWNDADYVVLVSGQDFPDALSAAPLAKKYDAPILLTERDNITSSALDEIKRLNPQNIFIIGGTGAVSKNVEDTLKNMGITITRIQGQDRYETSVEVAKIIGSSKGGFIASGENYPDAISVASIAASNQMPILLTTHSAIPEQTRDFINSNDSRYYVIGGDGAISESAVNNLPNYKRLNGKNRYETNTAVINEFLGTMDFNTVYVASGQGFADALAGSAAAAKTKSPTILVNNPSERQEPVVRSNLESISTIKILGGEGVVLYSVIDKLMSISIVITLDAGHGGYDPGAVGPSGLFEKNVTLSIALKAGKILEQEGINVIYTRTSDNLSWPANVGQDLQARTEISNNAGAKYFISIHANSSVSPAVNGIETFYSAGSNQGQKLAKAIQDELISATGLVDRGLKTANFYVLRNSDAPSVLVEVGFLSNQKEESLLARDDFQTKLAEAIAKGIIKVANQ